MRLLYDHNLSPRLVLRLQDVFPDSQHVRSCGLSEVLDQVIWDYARSKNYIIVTKDADFYDLSLLRGAPPKVIWLQVGNVTTARVEVTLRRHTISMYSFANDPIATILTLS
jgi:predicted nuclease of predicted toxin-antitoxin system